MSEKKINESASNFRFIFSYLIVSIEVILALLIGLLFIRMGLGGGAWILAGIVAGTIVFYIYHSFYNKAAKPNRNARKLGQIIVGLTIGFSLGNSNLAELSLQLPIFLLMTLFLLVCGVIIGYIYSRLENTDLLTAMLAVVPGNIGIMASMAADYQKNVPLVSLVQLMRFTSVIVLVPMVAKVSNSHDISKIISAITEQISIFDLKYTILLILVLLITVFTGKLGTKFKIPVAAFFCSIIVGLCCNSVLNLVPALADINFNLPVLLKLIGQVLLGVTIGEYWGINPRLKPLTVFCASAPVVMTFAASFITATIAMVFTDWDWLTCLLVASPGGSPEMILIALTLNHDVEIVTAGHLIRLIAINFLLPVLVSFVYFLERKSFVIANTTSVINDP